MSAGDSVRAPHTKISTVAASGKAASRPVKKMRSVWRAVRVMAVGEVGWRDFAWDAAVHGAVARRAARWESARP